MKVIPTPVRALWISFCRRFFGERVVRAPREFPLLPDPLSLHMVVSSHTWKMGLMALRSLEFQSGARWPVFIHDDGSLTDAAAAELQALQPDARLIRRAESDATILKALEPWPSCHENRGKHNWFLKYFDTFFYAPHERYIVLDSDIVFFRNPTLIRQWIDEQADTLHFMEDTRETYASPREDLEKAMGFDFWRSVNSGICLMVKPAVQLDLAERFLATFSGTAKHFMFLEQSLFAMTGSAWKKGGTLPKTYEISWNNFRSPEAVCRHYVGPFKDDLLWVEGAMSFWVDLKTGKRRA